jgi:hypothetical protein
MLREEEVEEEPEEGVGEEGEEEDNKLILHFVQKNK